MTEYLPCQDCRGNIFPNSVHWHRIFQFSNFPHLETTQHEPEAEEDFSLLIIYHLMHRLRALESETLVLHHTRKSVNRAAPKANFKVKDGLDM